MVMLNKQDSKYGEGRKKKQHDEDSFSVTGTSCFLTSGLCNWGLKVMMCQYEAGRLWTPYRN